MSKKKSALGGMGLDALLSIDDSVQEESTVVLPPEISNSVEDIPIVSIQTNPDQPRKTFSQDSLEELSESIRSRGVIQPIILETGG